MKQIIAVVPLHWLDDLRQALLETGIAGLTVNRVMGRGTRHQDASTHPDRIPSLPLSEMIRLEILVDETQASPILECILKIAKGGPDSQDKGKIFVCELRETIRVRTGETGVSALV